MPRDPTPIPFVPSPPSLELRILPEPESPPILEHNELERKLLEETKILSQEVPTGNRNIATEEAKLPRSVEVEAMVLPQEPIELAISLSPTKPHRPDLKIETPITPPISAKKRRTEEERKPLAELINDALLESPQPEESAKTAGAFLDDHLVEIAL